MRSAKMRKCENGQRIKCEVVFAFYTLQRINCEIKNAKFQYLTTVNITHEHICVGVAVITEGYRKLPKAAEGYKRLINPNW